MISGRMVTRSPFTFPQRLLNTLSTPADGLIKYFRAGTIYYALLSIRRDCNVNKAVCVWQMRLIKYFQIN